MGKIFGISDLPVSIPTSPFEPIIDFRNPYEDEMNYTIRDQRRIQKQRDIFISKSSKKKPNNSIRNAFNKLIKHFSKKI